jgi:hypothetical protein
LLSTSHDDKQLQNQDNLEVKAQERHW